MTAWRTDVYGQLWPLGFRPDGFGGLEAVYAPREQRRAHLTAVQPGECGRFIDPKGSGLPWLRCRLPFGHEGGHGWFEDSPR